MYILIYKIQINKVKYIKILKVYKMQNNTLQNSYKFIAALLKNKNVQAQKILKNILQSKCQQKIKDTLDQ